MEEKEAEMKSMNQKFQSVDVNLKTELKVKDEIQKRQENLCSVLKDEIVLAKKILMNSRVRSKVHTEFNFDQMLYYDYN